MATDASECVLVVAPTGRDAYAIVSLLESHSVQARACDGVRDACRGVAAGAGALVLTEESLERAELEQLLATLESQPPWSELPLIVLTTGGPTRLSRVLELLTHAARVVTILERPLSMISLLRNVQVALRSRRRQYQVRDLLAAQRESELRYRTLVRATSSITWTRSADGLNTEPQLEWMAYTGQTAHEALGAGWLNAVHADDVATAASQWTDAVRRGVATRSEHRVRRRDGEWRWMSVHAAPVTNDAGEILGWIGMHVDIHERKESERQLRESERRFATMADGVPAMIWVTDRDGRIEYANRQFREFYGTTLESVRRDGWESLVHPDDRDAFVTGHAAAVAAHTSHRARSRVRHRSGAWRWIESHGVPRFDDAGEFVGHVGLSPDVTELVEAESALLLADRRKDEFLATLAHELRNPIAPIRTAAQLLGTPTLSPDQLQWVQRVIQRQVTHMAGLLDDLLNIARVTRGKLELKKSRVDVASVVETAVEAARPLIDRKRHALEVRLEPDLPLVSVDPLRLAEVLTNLLTNAAKYTPAGGRIEASARAEPDALVLEVRDTGIGIEREALTQVFAMFAQVQGAAGHSEGGLGIGLALAKGLVELHGGRIEARSDGRGRGSTFIVRLPLAPPLNGQAVSGAQPDAARVKRRVLVVDDNRDAADMLAVLLRMHGHDVRTAYDGRTGLAAASEFQPDVAVLDIGLPDTTGYELARRLRAEHGAAIHLVALTGWGQEDDLRRARQAGFDHHFVKPVDADRLQSALADGHAQYACTPGRDPRHPPAGAGSAGSRAL